MKNEHQDSQLHVYSSDIYFLPYEKVIFPFEVLGARFFYLITPPSTIPAASDGDQCVIITSLVHFLY